MAARKKPTAYRVVGAAAVIRKDKHERYLYAGAIFAADEIDEANAEHLLGAKLIAPFEVPAGEPDPAATSATADAPSA